MVSTLPSRASALLAVFSLSVVACDHQEWRPLLPEGKANLVVVLKADLTQQEVNSFLEQELQVRASDGGKWLRPGIDAIVKIRVDSHQAYAVALDPSAAPREREAVREAVKSSPYVYRVFQNTAPEDIKLGESSPPKREDQSAEEPPPE